MNYAEFKVNFVNNVFNNYINDKKGLGRSNLASIYRNGKDAPRATLYRLLSVMNELQDTFLRQKNLDLNSKMNYYDFAQDVLNPTHPLIKKAHDEMVAANKEIYKNLKTRQLTKFVLLKQQIPLLKHFKFLAKFV